MTDELTTALLDQLGRVTAQGATLTALLEKIERQIATRPDTPPALALVSDEPLSTNALQPPSRQGSVLQINRWGHLKTTQAAPSRRGVPFTFEVGGAGTFSNPVWVQGSEEGPWPNAVDATDFIRALLIFDTIPVRAAGDLFSYQVTFDRLNWYTVTSLFGATVGIAAIPNSALVAASLGVRLVQTAGAAGAWVFQTRYVGV